jgi:3-phenylpropionate/trans-cinnamate dioxygenase ferredoxin subunit
MSWIEIARVDQVPLGTMHSFPAGKKQILIVNYEGQFYAIGNRCTHLGGDLSKGTLEGKIVTCPRHGSRFDVTTGACISGPHIGFLKLTTGDETSYQVRIEGNLIQVDVE